MPVPELAVTFETTAEAIDKIRQLSNPAYDLYGLTKATAALFESQVELSPLADPKNPLARLISQSAIESLVYLVQRSAEIAEEVNNKLHYALERFPGEQPARQGGTPNAQI